MIARVEGQILAIDTQSVVVNVHGFGLLVYVPAPTLATLHIGSDVVLYTTLVVREDSLTLFGFTTNEEKSLFDTLQSVRGIGPKVAVQILSVHTPESLRNAVHHNDAAALQRVPGIGKKGAERMLLELGNKLPAPTHSPESSSLSASSALSDVITALTGLGWSDQEAAAAASQAFEENAEADTQTLLRASLQALGKRR